MGRLRHIAPVVQAFGASHQCTKFQEKLNSGILTLDRTKDWIAAFFECEEQEDLRAGNGFDALHTTAVLSIVTSNACPSNTTIPETLLLELPRLIVFRREYNRIVDGITLLANTAHTIGNHPAVLSGLVDLIIRDVDVDTLQAEFSVTLDDAGVSAEIKNSLFRTFDSVLGSSTSDNHVRKLM